MNRQIKFRAWDSNKKTMCPVWNIAFKAWNQECYINYVTIEDDGTYDLLETECEIMQFTGLHDCEGKEIYEDDIILYDACYYRVTYAYNSPKFITILIYPTIGTEMYMFREELLDSDITPTSSIKIIGNIYQNPELLKIVFDLPTRNYKK